MNLQKWSRHVSRRDFMRLAAWGAAGAATWKASAAESVTFPFENGERPLVRYPQKRPLIRLTTRPPQLETPFEVFNEGVLTPNGAFFVRYHLTISPPAPQLLRPDTFRLTVKGAVRQSL